MHWLLYKKARMTCSAALFQVGYPALKGREVEPRDGFANFGATYLERDVRQMIAVRDLGQFQTFVQMCAARTGQLLEAGYIATLPKPHHRDFGKRLVKAPERYL